MQVAVSAGLELGGGDADLEHELRYNMAVWSAFKTHAEMDALGELLLDEQGADVVLFEFTKRDPKIGGKLQQLRQRGIHAFYYYSDDPDTMLEI